MSDMNEAKATESVIVTDKQFDASKFDDDHFKINADRDESITGVSADEITFQDYKGTLTIQTTGDGCITAFKAPKVTISGFSGSLDLNAAGEGDVTAFTSGNTILDGFTGKVSVRAGNNGYGIHSESASSLSVTESNGTFEVSAEGDAYGISQSQFMDETTASSNKTISINFDNQDLSFDVKSKYSSAYGISVSTQSYGKSLHQGHYDVIFLYEWDSYGTATSNLSMNSLHGHLTVQADLDAYGIYAFANGYSNSNDSGGGYREGVVNQSTKTNVSIADIEGEITVLGGRYASGIYADSREYSSAKSLDTVLSIDNISGNIIVKSTEGSANAAYSGKTLQITGDVSGDVSVQAAKTANVFIADGDLSIGKLSGNVEVNTAGGAAAFYAGGALTVNEVASEGIAVTSTGAENVSVFKAGASVTIQKLQNAQIDMESAQGAAVAVVAPTVQLTDYDGNTQINYNGNDRAAWISGTSVSLVNVRNEAKITSRGVGFGIELQANGMLNAEGLSGDLTIRASEDAYGIYRFNDDANSTSSTSAALTFDSMNLGYDIESENGNAAAISIYNAAYGHSERYSEGTWYTYYFGNYGSGIGTVSTGDINGHLTVHAAEDAYGVRSYAHGYWGNYEGYGDSHSQYSASKTISKIEIGDVNSDVIVVGGKNAYGICSMAEVTSTSKGTAVSDVSLQGIKGAFTVISARGDAVGVYSSDTITIHGDLLSDIVITSRDGNAAFLQGESVALKGRAVENSDQTLAMEISGDVIVDGARSASALVSNGGMDLDVSGVIAAGSFQRIAESDDIDGFIQDVKSLDLNKGNSRAIVQNATGTAIADGTLSGNSIVAAANDDSVELRDGAVVLGNVALGGGVNELTLHSGAAVYGDVTGRNLQLTYDLLERSESAVVTASSVGDFFAADTTLTVNIDNATQKGRYILASFGGGEDFSGYQDHAVKIIRNGQEYTVSLADDLSATGFADINLTQQGELELIYSEDFFALSSSLQNGSLSGANNGSLTITFSKAIDASQFRSSMVQLTDEDGKTVEIRDAVVNGRQLTVSFDPLTHNENYRMSVSSQIKSTDGQKLNQDLDETAGTAADDYQLSFKVDAVAPKVAKITPDSTISGTFSKFQMVFSETVAPAKILSAIKVNTPSGNTISPTRYRQLSGNVYEIVIPDQTTYGQYQIEIADSITDLAGNKLIGSHQASVTLTDVALILEDGSLSSDDVKLGETFSASWTTHNEQGTALFGDWTDGVYLSKDAVWDVNDMLLDTVVHSGGLDASQTLSSEKAVSITGAVEGEYYILIRSDINLQMSGLKSNAEAAQNILALPISVSVQTLAANTAVKSVSEGHGSTQIYHFEADAGRAYNITLDSLADSANMEIYVGSGYVPTRENYDKKAQKLTDGTLYLSASDHAQDLYIMAYNKGYETDLQYELRVEKVPAISITNLSGAKQSNKYGSLFDIAGTGFDNSVVVTLEDASGKVYRPEETNLVNDTRMQVKFAADTLGKGSYTLHLNSAKEGEYVHSEKVQIVRDFGGTVAVSSVTPQEVSARDYQNLVIKVRNTGYEYIDAPLVMVAPTHNGQMGALLSVSGSHSSTSFWTSSTPQGYSNSVTFLARGSYAGALAPSETVSIPVSYLGWNGATSSADIYWGVSYIYSDNPTPMDWNTVFSSANLNQELKELLVSRFQGDMPTLGNYVSMLNGNLSYLGSLGENTSTLSGEDVLQFELKQNIGWLSPYRVLLTSKDVSMETTGRLDFSVSREYYTDLNSREKQGSFGYGWVTSLDSYLEISESGDLTFHEGNAWRLYQPNFTQGYQTVSEDGSVMKALADGYKLTEQDGTVSMFDANGRLEKKTDANGNSISYSYDVNGKLVRLAHSSGVSYSIVRDGGGRITQISGSDGQNLAYSYDASGNLISAKNTVSGAVENFTYGAYHGLTGYTAADGTKSSFTYDASSNYLLSKISTRGGADTVSISYGKDAFVTVTDSQGHSYKYYYGADERIQKIVDNRTGETYYADYDSQRRLTSLKDSKGQSVSLSYDSKGNMTGIRDSSSNAVSFGYDNKGNVTSIRDVYGQTSTITYDSGNNPVSIRYADGTSESFTYDSKGNLLSATDEKGTTYSYVYDSQGRVTSVSGNEAQTSYGYDKVGNVTSVTFADGTRISYAYNGGNDMTQFTDAQGHSIRYDYTTGGSLSKITYADGSSESYSYNDENELTKWNNRRGGSVTYTRDVHGNVTKIAQSDGTTVSCAYDAQGRLTSAGDMRFTYDGSDNITEVTCSDGRRIAYAFDDSDRIVSIDDGKTTTRYSYTVQGDLDKLTTASGALIVDYDYDSFGRLSKVTNGNGTKTIYTYNEYGEVSAIDHLDKGGTVTGFEHYTYNADNRCTVKETQDGTWTYTYDKVGQLTGAVLTKDGETLRNEAYTYDSVGNRTKSVIDGVTTTYVYNELNQIVSANGFAYRYDTDGNLLEDEKRIYTWTTDNRVATETDKASGQTWTYGYDALGNRTSVTTNGVTTTYTVDPNGNVLAEYVNGVFSRSYIQGNQLAAFTDASGNTYYFNADLLGSTIGITNGSGITVNSYSYDSFGNVLNSTEGVANDFEFVGGYGLMSNASGTTFVRARNYDAETGRWISADPIGINGGENLYVYCGNEPLGRMDWRGNEPRDVAMGYGETYGSSLTNTALQGGLRNNNTKVAGVTGKSYGRFLNAVNVAHNVHDGVRLAGVYSNMIADAEDYRLSLENDDIEGYLERTARRRQNAAILGGAIDVGSVVPVGNAGTPVPTRPAMFYLSRDPNDKTVAEGYGEEKYIAAGSELNYTVMFENDPEWATAPARWVRVYDTLSDKYDLDTFELKSFTVAGNFIEVGDGRDSYNQQDWITVNGEEVLLKSSINLVTDEDSGETQLVCEFMAIDPETGALLPDITKGFLYPNDETAVGEGSVDYSISVKSDLADGTKVENTAQIYFDFNDPIDTPTTVNTIDGINPVVDEFAYEIDKENANKITFTVAGSDAESGIFGYNLAYSEDGKDFFLFATTSDNTFTCEADLEGDLYFLAQAIDNAGNVSEWIMPGGRSMQIDDDWADLKTAGAAGSVGTFRNFGAGASYADQVGKEDPTDYRAFTLDSAASLQFLVGSENAAKFTVYSLQSKTDKKGVTTYSLKSLQSTSVKAGQSVTTKSLLLDKGTYYIGVDNTDKKKSDADYSVTVASGSVFFTKGDNSDDWTDMKTSGAAGLAASVGTVDKAGDLLSGWVGFGDAVDYKAFTFESAANLAFDLNASDAAKFTVYSLQSKTDKKGVTTYSLKSLQSTTLKAGKDATTKNLLLEKGTYYIAMESTNAKKGGSADYTVAVSEKTAFFTKGDNSDDWTDMKTSGAAGLADSVGTVDKAGDLLSGWVGYGDAVDYKAFTLESAANLAFDLNASDAAKFTVYSLQSKTDKKGVTTYSLKSLQSTTLKAGKDATTKNLLLEKGTYYIAMESTNAKKGGSADYTVAVSEKTAFFTKGDNGDDWTDMKTSGAAGLADSVGTVDKPGDLLSGWVGYGDAVDYRSFTLESAANLAFDLNVSDAAKFTIYALQSKTDKKGNTTYSLKSLQSTTLKAGKDATTKNLLLEKGTYYVAMESTNAKKGGSADYTVAVSKKTTFFTKGDNSDDWTDMKTEGAAGLADPINLGEETGDLLNGWVGYGDAVDYKAFTLDRAADLSFDLDVTDAAKFSVFSLQDKTDKSGVTTHSLKSLQSTTLKTGQEATTKSLHLEAGTYYLAMESTNAKKGGSVDYSVAVADQTRFYADDTDIKKGFLAGL